MPDTEEAGRANLATSRYYRLLHREQYNGPMIRRQIVEVQEPDAFHHPMELLTIKEVAEFLKISIPTVRRLQQERRLPFIKVGGSVRFTKSDVLDYLKKKRIEAIQ